MKVELETERLILKTLDSIYTDSVLQYYKKNRDFFQSKVPEYSDNFFTAEYHSDNLKKMEKNSDNGHSIKMFLFLRNDNQAVIGDIAISNIVRGPFLSCHLGYKLDENQTGKGYASEAVRKITDYVFNELCLHRIEANIMPSNDRSRKLVERLGFINEGISKKYLKINGKWEDHIHYVLLNEKME